MTDTITLSQLVANATNLLNNEAAANYIGVTPGTLNVWRSTKTQKIRHLKVGAKVFYRKEDLDAYLNSCVVDQ
jgi:hypothetical protein